MVGAEAANKGCVSNSVILLMSSAADVGDEDGEVGMDGDGEGKKNVSVMDRPDFRLWSMDIIIPPIPIPIPIPGEGWE